MFSFTLFLKVGLSTYSGLTCNEAHRLANVFFDNKAEKLRAEQSRFDEATLLL